MLDICYFTNLSIRFINIVNTCVIIAFKLLAFLSNYISKVPKNKQHQIYFGGLSLGNLVLTTCY